MKCKMYVPAECFGSACRRLAIDLRVIFTNNFSSAVSGSVVRPASGIFLSTQCLRVLKEREENYRNGHFLDFGKPSIKICLLSVNSWKPKRTGVELPTLKSCITYSHHALLTSKKFPGKLHLVTVVPYFANKGRMNAQNRARP